MLGQRGRVRDVASHVLDRRWQRRDGVPNVVLRVVDCVEQRPRLVDGFLCRAHGGDEFALLACGFRGCCTAHLDVALGQFDVLAGHHDVRRDRCEGRFGEFGVQPSQHRLRFGHTDGQRDDRLRQRVERRPRVDQQVTHLLEFGHARVEFVIGPAARRDDLDQHRTALIRGFGNRVVETLANFERGAERLLRLLERGDERGRRRVAELRSRDREFFFAGPYRVVGLDEHGVSPRVEHVERQSRQCSGVGGVDSFRGLDACLLVLLLPSRRIGDGTATGDDDRTRADEPRSRRSTGSGGRIGVGEGAGRDDRRPCPVLLAQSGFDVVRLHLRDLGVGDLGQPGGDPHAVGTVDGRDCEQDVAIAEAAGLSRRLCPRRWIGVVEVGDVDHPQPDTIGVVQVVDRSLHVGNLTVVESLYGVGDLTREPGRSVGRRRCRGTQQRCESENRREDTDCEEAPDCHGRRIYRDGRSGRSRDSCHARVVTLERGSGPASTAELFS
ncbi:hypothetical protein RhoFasB10_04868 [Rhodococcus sp. B10]|nr:hypothetical protein [Rhodococcus sp. B10]